MKWGSVQDDLGVFEFERGECTMFEGLLHEAWPGA